MKPTTYEVTAKGTLTTFGGRLSQERIAMMVKLAFENDMIENIEVEVKEVERSAA